MSEDDIKQDVDIIEADMKIKDYKPLKTSKYISVYEYAKVLTELSLFLFKQKSLSRYIDNIEIKNIIDTNKVAYELLKNGVFDAVLDRGIEKVLFSNLKINPLYNSMIETFLKEQEDNINNSFLDLINILPKK